MNSTYGDTVWRIYKKNFLYDIFEQTITGCFLEISSSINKLYLVNFLSVYIYKVTTRGYMEAILINKNLSFMRN